MINIESKKLNSVNKKLTLSKSNFYSADGTVRLVSFVLMAPLGIKILSP
jgi:hypothetical protein